MGNQKLFILVACTMLTACSAFDDGGNVVLDDVLPDGTPNIAQGGEADTKFQGFYSGTRVLDSNSCTSVEEAAGAEDEFAVDVIHSGTVISFQLEDGSEFSGELTGTKAVLLYKELSRSWIYDVEFSEEGVKGKAELVESVVDGQLGDPCAVYSLDLLKTEKPEGWGEAEEEESEEAKKPAS